jgi:phage gp45-like
MSDSSYQAEAYMRVSGNGIPAALVVKTEGGPGILNDNGAVVFNQRIRSTAAEVNTGKTLVAAIPGHKIRLIDATLIAIGGAATTATSVDILATQATASAKLVAAAVAALTQSAVVKPNSANVTVLADGASFVPNDAATALTIGKTGGSLAGSSHIDAIISYTIEPA